MGFFGLFRIRGVGIIIHKVFGLFLFICSYLFSCSRGWKVIFIDLCVVLINLWDSFSQVRFSVGAIVGQGIPVVAFSVEVFIYCFALPSSPDFVFTESEECITSSVSRVVFIYFLNFAVCLCKAKAT